MRRGFTVVELAIVLSISALLVPLVFLTARSWDEHRAAGLRQVAVADEVRSLGEAVRADRRALKFAGKGSLTLQGKGPCSPVEYAVTDAQTLVRRAPAACGGETALATHVTALAHAPGGLAVTFGFEVRPGTVVPTDVFIAVAD